jgi:diguanylate cyclase (GGDEF)-like protein
MGVVPMRRAAEFGLWCVVWWGYVFVARDWFTSPQGVGVMWLAGGIAAGFLLLRDRNRWWLILVPYGVVLAAWSSTLDVSLVTLVVRSIEDPLAIAAYAWVVSRHRQAHAGLGASVAWVCAAALLAAGIRLTGIVGLLLGFDLAESEFLQAAMLEIGVGTLVGLVAGSATVLGLFAWSAATDRAVRHPTVAITAMISVVMVVLVFLSPMGAVLPGAEFLVVPALLALAVLGPPPLTALVVGVTLLVISVASVNSLGAFSSTPATTTPLILSVQLYLLTITVSAFLLSAVTDERRRARLRAVRNAEVMDTVFRDLPIAAAWVTVGGDGGMQVRRANPAFLSLVGVADGEEQDRPLTALLSASATGDAMDVRAGRDLQLQRKDGRVMWLRPTLSRPEPPPEVDDVDEADEPLAAPDSAVLVLEDVTVNHTSEELLRLRARRDPLTRLLSRQVFIDELDEVLGSAHGPAGVALFAVNIDGLRAVNHSLGPEVGDRVILEVVRRVSTVLTGHEVMGRTAGDEVAILRPLGDGEAEQEAFGEAILNAMRAPFRIGDEAMTVTVSVGMAVGRAHRTAWADLMRGADVAVRAAKGGGRDRLAVYDPAADEAAGDRLRIGQQLRAMVAADDLVCLYQPLMHIESGRVTSAELLVRMRDGEGNLVSPAQFMSMADDMGLTGAITQHVMRHACEAALGWHRAGTDVRVAFNAPPAWISLATVAVFDEFITATGAPRELLTVEVTEDRALDPGCEAYVALSGLRDTGVHVAIDDFGTGYSGLDAFRSSPADIVKVDMAFVSDMLRTDEDREIVRSMLDLVHRFGKTSVAEGVETLAQLQALREMGCGYAQGYLIGRPMPRDELPAGQVLFPPS